LRFVPAEKLKEEGYGEYASLFQPQASAQTSPSGEAKAQNK